MKKIFIIIIAIILIVSTIFLIRLPQKKDKNTETSKEVFNSDYIETIPENAKIYLKNFNSDILKTKEEIDDLNKEIFVKSESMFDLKNITTVSKEEITNYITNYKLPTLPKYNGDKIVTNEEKELILANRNLDMIENKTNPQHGIIVNRANLRSFPTNIHFYDIEGVLNFDSLQESELLINSEVVILHESKDKEWYFVLSNAYAGWVEKNKIALITDEDRDYFLENKDFLIITAPSLNIDNKIFDMSVKLPFNETKENGYEVTIPVKGEDEYVKKEKVIIERDKGHIGYLDYTNRNVIIQAFKYENIPYSWAGLDENVDCSAYVSNIYRTFGFNFPRNTKEQNKSVGEIISLTNKSRDEKLEIIKDKAPALLYQSGHVMLYLGNIEDKHYIIHASGDLKNMKVLVSLLNDSSYLDKINQINILN